MFNYFLPGRTKTQLVQGDKLDREVLRTLGLDEVLADVSKVEAHASVLDVRNGCGGKAGAVIAPVRKYRGVLPQFFSHDLMTWKEIRPGQLWLGWMSGDTPLPQDLERWEVIGGAELTDDSGGVWTLPIARAPHMGFPYGTLPQSYSFDTEGEPKAHLEPAYQWLWDLSGEIRDWYAADEGPDSEATPAERAAHRQLPFSDLVKYAARIVGVNYRVGTAELSVLHERGCRLLKRSAVHAICQAAYGWEVEQEAKKKPPADDSAIAPNSSPSTTGENIPAAAPGTGPAAELLPQRCD
jgi:hypothetical protein